MRAGAVLLGSSVLVIFSSAVLASERPARPSGVNATVAIPGASRAGSEDCAVCHPDTAGDFKHAFHKQQGVECEGCHGDGSLHIQGSGDVTKIVSFTKSTVRAANDACLRCHTRNEEVRHWSGGTHSASHVRCAECHQIHGAAASPASGRPIGFDISTRGALAAQSVTPETSVKLRSRSDTNEACLRCHRTEGAQLSLPYHHPLREGKMSCVDCHDPHGGPAGNNLRTANVNQLCVGCHAQYRGPYAYQHPPVTESCMTCHTAHGSPNTNLLAVSVPALCLQCHSGHHNGAGLPMPDRCTNCHGSIHGTDVATPSGGSRFVDKGPVGVPSEPPQPMGQGAQFLASRSSGALPSTMRPVPSHVPTYAAAGDASAALAMMSSGYFSQWSGGGAWGGNAGSVGSDPEGASSAFSFTPGAYRAISRSGFLGRVGEYDSLRESAGADAVVAYVAPQNRLTVVSRANFLSRDDYSAASDVTVGEGLQVGFDIRSFVQQQDIYPFYAGVMSPDLLPITDLVPSHATVGVTRRLGSAYARARLPKLPVHLFVKANWQARDGMSQLAYLDENATPNCGETCHFTSRLQQVNYTTRTIAAGAEVDWGSARLTWEHRYSSFQNQGSFPVGNYAGPFTPGDEPPPPPVPVPPDIPAGNYYLDIAAPSHSSSDSVDLAWTPSSALSVNGHVGYTRLRNTFTGNPQRSLDSDGTLTWRPMDRVRLTADFHQHSLTNKFTPFYDFYGNVSYDDYREGVRIAYQLAHGFEVEGQYRRRDISRSNASLWPQAYSFNNTDLLAVVPSSGSNTAAFSVRYHDRGQWSGRAGYVWTGTRSPGYLVVPENNHRLFANVWLTRGDWLTLSNDASVNVQNGSPSIQLPNGLGNFERRNRYYLETASATVRPVAGWNLGLGYSYQRNDLTTYMAFQNDSSVGYVVDEPAVPYKQTSQAFWAETAYTVKQRLGLNLRLVRSAARSGMSPDVNPNDAALLGNAPFISDGTFDPTMFRAALENIQTGATLVSQVIAIQWIGQAKVSYQFPNKFEGGLVFYYGKYRDQWRPNLNGVLRTFAAYVGRAW
jgi:predicted CXXCH cytochrome family protein